MTRIRSFCAALLALAIAIACATGPGPARADAKPDPAMVRIALAQLHSNDAGDQSVIAAMVAQAAADHAEMVVFPESSQFGWLNPTVFDAAQALPGPMSSALARLAAEHGVWIAFGMAERGAPLQDGRSHPYDTAVLIDPTGRIALHSRKANVLQNAFTGTACPPEIKAPDGSCAYAAAPVSALSLAETPLGRTALLVCADAYAYDTAALDRVRDLGAEAVLIVWGVTAASAQDCGKAWFNATIYAEDAARVTGALTIGANAVGPRPFGRYQPSVYCGFSGIVSGEGRVLGQAGLAAGVTLIDVPRPAR